MRVAGASKRRNNLSGSSVLRILLLCTVCLTAAASIKRKGSRSVENTANSEDSKTSWKEGNNDVETESISSNTDAEKDQTAGLEESKAEAKSEKLEVNTVTTSTNDENNEGNPRPANDATPDNSTAENTNDGAASENTNNTIKNSSNNNPAPELGATKPTANDSQGTVKKVAAKVEKTVDSISRDTSADTLNTNSKTDTLNTNSKTDDATLSGGNATSDGTTAGNDTDTSVLSNDSADTVSNKTGKDGGKEESKPAVVSDKDLIENPAFNVTKLFPTKPPANPDKRKAREILKNDLVVVVNETEDVTNIKSDVSKPAEETDSNESEAKNTTANKVVEFDVSAKNKTSTGKNAARMGDATKTVDTVKTGDDAKTGDAAKAVVTSTETKDEAPIIKAG